MSFPTKVLKRIAAFQVLDFGHSLKSIFSVYHANLSRIVIIKKNNKQNNGSREKCEQHGSTYYKHI